MELHPVGPPLLRPERLSPTAVGVRQLPELHHLKPHRPGPHGGPARQSSRPSGANRGLALAVPACGQHVPPQGEAALRLLRREDLVACLSAGHVIDCLGRGDGRLGACCGVGLSESHWLRGGLGLRGRHRFGECCCAGDHVWDSGSAAGVLHSGAHVWPRHRWDGHLHPRDSVQAAAAADGGRQHVVLLCVFRPLLVVDCLLHLRLLHAAATPLLRASTQ
mmetsp:Transcript_119/g.400  ORF Transcript_119/g.400 Transcript_119/m.400 type:complete len:220 (+) Transcript_119:355-1014(+)